MSVALQLVTPFILFCVMNSIKFPTIPNSKYILRSLGLVQLLRVMLCTRVHFYCRNKLFQTQTIIQLYNNIRPGSMH